jgi:hypothetical protein
MFEFPYIPRPVVIHDLFKNTLADLSDPDACFFRKFLNKISCQHRNILPPGPERWQANGKYIQAVVKVGSEPARLHFLIQVAIGGGDDPHINVDGILATYSFNLPFLQSAKQLNLQFQRQLTYFIQEKGAIVRLFEFAQPSIRCTGKTTPFVSKQFRFNEIGGQGRAIHLDHRLGFTG